MNAWNQSARRSSRGRISRTSQPAIRGPSRFVGFGYRPSAIPLYHVDFETGKIANTSFRRIYPTWGNVRCRPFCSSPLEKEPTPPKYFSNSTTAIISPTLGCIVCRPFNIGRSRATTSSAMAMANSGGMFNTAFTLFRNLGY